MGKESATEFNGSEVKQLIFGDPCVNKSLYQTNIIRIPA